MCLQNMAADSKSASSSPKSDFSIEHILTRAGVKKENSTPTPCFSTELTWLSCTRYCPPKLPRSQKKEGPQKRQLGRHPRIPFSSHQLAVLEEKFKKSPYLSSTEVTHLSQSLQLADVRVKIWFQNRRARERREKHEQSLQSTVSNQMSSKSPNISPPRINDVTFEEKQMIYQPNHHLQFSPNQISSSGPFETTIVTSNNHSPPSPLSSESSSPIIYSTNQRRLFDVTIEQLTPTNQNSNGGKMNHPHSSTSPIENIQRLDFRDISCLVKKEQDS